MHTQNTHFKAFLFFRRVLQCNESPCFLLYSLWTTNTHTPRCCYLSSPLLLLQSILMQRPLIQRMCMWTFCVFCSEGLLWLDWTTAKRKSLVFCRSFKTKLCNVMNNYKSLTFLIHIAWFQTSDLNSSDIFRLFIYFSNCFQAKQNVG